MLINFDKPLSMKNGMYTVTIPVKKHIEKYITFREGNPIPKVTSSGFWNIIRPYMVYKVNHPISNAQKQNQIQGLQGKISIQLQKSQLENYGVAVRPGGVILLNKALDYIFSSELYWHVSPVESQVGRYKGYNDAIEGFADKYGIELEVDISSEALKKIFFRRRKLEQTIAAKNVPPAQA